MTKSAASADQDLLEKSTPEVLFSRMRRGLDLTARDAEGLQPHHRVCAHNTTEAFSALLFERAPLLETTKDGDHVLILALEREDAETLDLLRLALQNGAADLINTPGSLGLPPLVLAAALNNTAAMELLLAFGADPNAADAEGDDALCKAIANNNPAMAWLLIQNKYDVKPLPQNAGKKNNPLTVAIAKGGARDILDFLLAFGADANAANKQGVTPLMAASERGDADVIGWLLSAGADATAVDKSQKTVLMYGAPALTQDAAQLLIAAGADMNRVDETGSTALMLALDRQNRGLSQALIAAGAKTDVLNKEKKSALSIAIKRHMPDMLQMMLDRKAPCEKKHIHGYTALHVACRAGCPDMVQKLLAAGANPNAQDDFLMTPLVHALRFPEIVRLLLNGGADPLLRTKANRTALHYARNLREPATAAVIEEFLDRKNGKPRARLQA